MDPKELRGARTGSKALVIGLGETASRIGSETSPITDAVTIGVNDIARLLHPDFLMVADPPSRFYRERMGYILGSRSHFVTYRNFQNEWLEAYAQRLTAWTGFTAFDMLPTLHTFLDPAVQWLPMSTTSTYPALGLAAYLGCNPIGLIGVDFQKHHFFTESQRYERGFSKGAEGFNTEYGALAKYLHGRGIIVKQLSERSVIVSIPRCSLEEFFDGAAD